MSSTVLNTKIVSRNDTAANWTTKNPVLLKGELGIEIDTNLIKIGNGTATWTELPYVNESAPAETTYHAIPTEGQSDLEAIAAVVGAAELHEGDTAIVTRNIGTAEHKSYTAYVYNGSAWAAMDGNYDASNVYFDADFTATEKVGTISIPSSGSTTVAAQGKSVKEFLAALLASEKQPSATQPAVSVNVSTGKAYEVGTTVTPTYSASLSAGSYTYGPQTGSTAKTWSITNSATDEILTTATGSFAPITVGDSTNYSVTATATYDAGAMPKTNIGNDAPDKQIAAGSKSATASQKITGFRNFFYGGLTTSTAEAPLTSAIIRGLTAGGAYNGPKTLNVNAAAGWKRIVVAIPASSTRAGITLVNLVSTLNADITADYKVGANVVVEGADGYRGVEYKVYTYEPAKLDASEQHKITLG